MKNRIYLKQWLELKPYVKQTITDIYYLRLSNDIKKVLIAPDSFSLFRFLNEKEIDLLSCFMVSYLEDVISETNIWNSFINMHKELYKKKLPFYNTDDYFDGEINVQDVSFLIWYFLNTIQEEKFISPYNDFIVNIASRVMEILESEYEYAPENEHIKSFYTINENENDFYIVRNLIDTILFKTYLFYTDTSKKLAELEDELIENTDEDDNLLAYLQDNRDSFVHKNHTRLLSMKGKEWAAKILGDKYPVCNDLLNMSQRIRGYFLYKGQDEDDIFIEHIASGKKFKLTKKSFDNYLGFKEIDTIIFIGIVKWKHEWWFSGVHFQTDFDADLILDERNSLNSRMDVNFLDHDKQDTKDLLIQQLDAFMAFNNGFQIAFLPSNNIDQFYKDYGTYFNDSLNLSNKEKEQARKRMRKDGYFGDGDENDNKADFSEVSETGLVFFNTKSGVEIALDVNNAFPLSNNPYFNIEESEDDIMKLLVSEEMSTELAKYCIDNCKSDLAFFNGGAGKIYLKDIDFLLRFWKKENYHSKPSVTYTGQKE